MRTLAPKTLDAVLTIAAWQVGVQESPANSNRCKYNDWYYGRTVSGSAYPWCVTFIQWVFSEAGYNLHKTASCGALLNRYKSFSPKQVVTSGYKPGDLVLFDFSGRKTATQHIGIVESVCGDGTLNTIEGNTAIGNDSNGGAVMRRKRSPSLVTAAIRPNY